LIKSENKLRELSEILANGEPLIVAEYVSALRNTEPLSGSLRLLAELYGHSPGRMVRRAVEDYFNNIKDETAQNELIELIKMPLSDSVISMLVSSCWQSGLDYSAHIELFADLFIISDYSIAVECMTLIGENKGHCPTEKITEIRVKIEGNLTDVSIEKADLTRELIGILST
jgi:hypothetical protein